MGSCEPYLRPLTVGVVDLRDLMQADGQAQSIGHVASHRGHSAAAAKQPIVVVLCGQETLRCRESTLNLS